MRQVTLHIPNKKYDLFIEIARSITFIKNIEEKEEMKDLSKGQNVAGIKQAVTDETIYLLDIYDKSEEENITDKDLL